MKPANKIIIYDDSCPLCEAYTAAFIKAGFLQKDGRQSFAHADESLLARIDLFRSKDEIPLLDLHTGKVLYGIDALLDVLSQKFSFIKPMAMVRPINWVIRKLYKLISYNRRVIVAPKKNASGFDCTPFFNIRYRLAFIIIGLIFNTMILFPLYTYILRPLPLNDITITQLQMAHLLLVVTNMITALLLKKEKSLEFLGQINMVALITMLLLIPLLIINKYLSANLQLNLLYCFGLAIIMGKAYFRRMRYAGINISNSSVIATNLIAFAVFLLYIIW